MKTLISIILVSTLFVGFDDSIGQIFEIRNNRVVKSDIAGDGAGSLYLFLRVLTECTDDVNRRDMILVLNSEKYKGRNDWDALADEMIAEMSVQSVVRRAMGPPSGFIKNYNIKWHGKSIDDAADSLNQKNGN